MAWWKLIFMWNLKWNIFQKFTQILWVPAEKHCEFLRVLVDKKECNSKKRFCLRTFLLFKLRFGSNITPYAIDKHKEKSRTTNDDDDIYKDMPCCLNE